MKLFSNFVGSILLIATAIVFPSTAFAQDNNIVTISTGEWAPFVSEDAARYGIAPHIITAAFSKVGLRTKFVFYPWSRAMKEAEDSNVDLSGIWFHNDERAEKFIFSDTVVKSANVFFYRKDRPFDWQNINDFPRDIIGVTRGYSYGSAFDKAVAEGRVNAHVTQSDILNFRKLLRGRIDAFPMGELVGYNLLRNAFTSIEANTLAVHPRKISAESLHLIAVKGKLRSEKLIRAFNQGMEVLRASGEFEQILEQYK